MARKSKFEKGKNVTSILHHKEYEILEITKDSLVVKPVGLVGPVITCKKKMFEVLE